MRFNETIISSAQVVELFRAELADCLDGLENRNGNIVAVVRRNLRFERSTLAQMNSTLTSAGYDQFSLRMNTDGTFTIADGTQLEHDLAEWVDREGGRASEAADKIKTAFYSNQPLLELSDLSLRTLPKAILNPLTNLQTLHISDNQLTDLELPDFTTLLSLGVFCNQLTTLHLPDSCRGLRTLRVSCDQLTTLHIPDSYRNLTTLSVSGNQLTNLHIPDAVFRNERTTFNIPDSYRNLTTLSVSGNQLTNLHIPDSFRRPGNLSGSGNRLTTLQRPNFYRNRERSLSPLSGNQLTETEVTQTLPQRLQVWSNAAANKQFDFSFIENFSQRHKNFLLEWLRRLERIKDFNGSNKPELALIVCQMVSSLNTDSEFKEQFFAQVEDNLGCCNDRAAMSFNEIFVAWRLRSLINSQLEDKEQLNLMIAAAKTLTLQKEIARKIAGKPGQEENVEIYLYYESALRDKLNLLTAMYQMDYASIGNKTWINKEELERHVNANYLETLCALPIFEAMATKDSACSSRLIQLKAKSYEQLAEIYREKETKKDGEYQKQSEKIQSKYFSKKKKILEEWARERIARM